MFTICIAYCIAAIYSARNLIVTFGSHLMMNLGYILVKFSENEQTLVQRRSCPRHPKVASPLCLTLDLLVEILKRLSAKMEAVTFKILTSCGILGFLHRNQTIQEYFAACFLTQAVQLMSVQRWLMILCL